MDERKTKLPPGVQNHHGKIRIWFIYNGKRHYEPLHLSFTPTNIKAAAKLRAEIVQAIKYGVFDYAQHFPESPNALDENKIITFGAYARKWLEGIKPILAFSTFEGYEKIMNYHWLPVLETKPLNDIKATDILAIAAQRQFKSIKTRNNCLSPLKLMLETAFQDGLIDQDLSRRLKAQKIQKEPPDPFTLEEVDRILNHIKHRYHEQHLNYFEFAFFTGMRTSELIALKWQDIDWHQKTATVRRAQVRHQTKETTKTSQIRIVDLGTRALEALNRQRPHTQMKNEIIFENHNTGEPYLDDRPMREYVWTPTLKALGLRHRPCYATRHTRATMILMSGAQPAWGAAQLGHSPQIFLNVYSRWINAADQGRELAKVEAHTTRQNNQHTKENIPQ